MRPSLNAGAAMTRWMHLCAIGMIGFVLHAGAALVRPEPAEARGMRGPRMAIPRMKVPRMKTYRFNGKEIRGYRNFVRERRAAKMASGSFKMRKDGSIIRKDLRIRPGRASANLPVRPMPAAPAAGAMLGLGMPRCRRNRLVAPTAADQRHSRLLIRAFRHRAPRRATDDAQSQLAADR